MGIKILGQNHCHLADVPIFFAVVYFVVVDDYFPFCAKETTKQSFITQPHMSTHLFLSYDFVYPCFNISISQYEFPKAQHSPTQLIHTRQFAKHQTLPLVKVNFFANEVSE